MRRLIALVIVIGLLAAACGGGDSTDDSTEGTEATTSSTSTSLDDGRRDGADGGEPAGTSSSTTSTTAPPPPESTTSSTTEATGPVSALNGLPIADEALLDRRAIAVKIDNHFRARPQTGLLESDAVVELLVEGGFTRFITFFHTTDVERLGPVRSGRPTDPTLIRPTGAVLTISGAQNWVYSIIIDAGVNMLGEGAGTYRISSRSAPHNLYATTLGLRDAADGRGYRDEFDGPLYDIAPWASLPEAEASKIDLSWDPSHSVSWTYEDGRYSRFEGTTAHDWIDQDGNQQQIAVDVLVVLTGEKYTASGSSGSAVPATKTVGSGTAYVFHEGRVAEGTWSRDSITEPFTLTDADGNPLTVPPGFPWISVFPNNRPFSFS